MKLVNFLSGGGVPAKVVCDNKHFWTTVKPLFVNKIRITALLENNSIETAFTGGLWNGSIWNFYITQM